MPIMFFFIYSKTFEFEKKNCFYRLTISNSFYKVRDSEIAKFEIVRLFLERGSVDAQGTETFVRNSEVFGIARVRDSESRLYKCY